MSKVLRAIGLGSVLALIVAFMAHHSQVQAYEDGEIKNAQKDILAMAKLIADGKDVSKEAKAAKKKYEELNTVMHAYKPSPKGGIGTGLPPKAGDGIEIKIINLGKRSLSASNLEKEKAVLEQIGYINAAIADITKEYAPKKPRGGKGPKDWNQYCDDMRKASLDLVKAAKAGKAADIKTAANNLNNSCNNCHSDFRDS